MLIVLQAQTDDFCQQKRSTRTCAQIKGSAERAEISITAGLPADTLQQRRYVPLLSKAARNDTGWQAPCTLRRLRCLTSAYSPVRRLLRLLSQTLYLQARGGAVAE